MEGFKNSTRMTIISDVAPQAYAKGGSVKAGAKFPIKRKGGGSSALTRAEQRMIDRDRPTNASGSSGYKMGGKVGGSKVPC